MFANSPIISFCSSADKLKLGTVITSKSLGCSVSDCSFFSVSSKILSIIIGVVFGVFAAWKARTAVDFTSVVSSLVVWSLPTFWLAIILLFWGSNNGLPLAGKATPGSSSLPLLQQWVDIGRHMLLPTLTYTIVYMGEYTLIMRSSLMDVLSEDYILTAKAKGLSTFQILKDHALKNAMLPLVTVIAINLGFTVAGAIQIEGKKEMKARGLASPDAADALCVTFAYPVAHRQEYVDKRPNRVYSGASVATGWMGH